MITNLFFKKFTCLQVSQLINEFVKDVHNVLDIDNLDLWPGFQSLYIIPFIQRQSHPSETPGGDCTCFVNR